MAVLWRCAHESRRGSTGALPARDVTMHAPSGRPVTDGSPDSNTAWLCGTALCRRLSLLCPVPVPPCVRGESWVPCRRHWNPSSRMRIGALDCTMSHELLSSLQAEPASCSLFVISSHSLAVPTLGTDPSTFRVQASPPPGLASLCVLVALLRLVWRSVAMPRAIAKNSAVTLTADGICTSRRCP